jgi:hypothetical protein
MFSMRNARWLRLLAYVTGSVNQELLVRNECLAADPGNAHAAAF